MITLNDYLFSGDTVLKILLQYSADLKEEAIKTHNTVDLAHSNFLIQIIELLEHTDFLTSQSQRIKEFYMYMTQKYPFLAFTFKGRNSDIRKRQSGHYGYCGQDRKLGETETKLDAAETERDAALAELAELKAKLAEKS